MNMDGRPEFLAFVTDETSAATLRHFADARGWGAASVQSGDIKKAAEYLSKQRSPRLLVVEIADAETAPQALDALADVCEPGVQVVAAGTINEYSFFCWLQEIGVAHYLLKPFDAAALEGMVRKFSAPAATPAADAKPACTVISVIGARGGCGASTLAANLASVIAQGTKQQTVILDLDPQQGTIALTMDVDPGRGLREALEKPDRIDGLFLERVMTKYNDNLHIMSAEESFDEVVNYNDQAADKLLAELQKKFAFVVVDLPRQMHVLTRAMLRLSDQVLVVTELNIAGLRDALRLSDFCRDILKTKPAQVIANRTGMVAGQDMPAAEFEKALKTKLFGSVPFDPALFAAGNQGELLLEKNPTAPSVAALNTLAMRCVPQLAKGKKVSQTEKPASGFALPPQISSLLDGLLGGGKK